VVRRYTSEDLGSAYFAPTPVAINTDTVLHEMHQCGMYPTPSILRYVRRLARRNASDGLPDLVAIANLYVIRHAMRVALAKYPDHLTQAGNLQRP